MSRDELAWRFRAKALINGREYISEPDYATADRYLAGKPGAALQPSVFNAAGVTPVEELIPKDAIWGNDDRIQKRNNTTFPFSAMLLLSQESTTFAGNGAWACTATMIGPTTAVTAAHCVHNGTSFSPWLQWAPGVDSLDANKTPYGWQNRCYTPVVPGGWDSNRDVEDDYAIIEFSNMYASGCGLAPGNATSWLGLFEAGTATIENNTGYMYGYPWGNSCRCSHDQEDPDGACSTCNWPSIWGHGNGTPEVDSSNAIEHELDTVGGMSGSAIYMIVDPPGAAASGRYIFGINKGSREDVFGNDDGHGRRVYNGFINWVQNASAL